MGFDYQWENKEASFGPPVKKQVDGGTHISFEILLRKNGKFIALRRPEAIPGHEMPLHAHKNPKGLLYFCHNLIRYGESAEECVKRIVKDQAGVSVKKITFVYLDSSVQEKDNQWAIIPCVVADIEKIPKPGRYGNEVTEIVSFDKQTIPNDFGWWSQKDLKEFLKEL